MTVAGSVRGRRSDFRALAPWRKVRAAVLKRDNRRCRIRLDGCKGVANEADHIVPVNDGGERYALNNLRAACGSCNKRRNKRIQGVHEGVNRTLFKGRVTISPPIACLSTHSRRKATLAADYSRKVPNARG